MKSKHLSIRIEQCLALSKASNCPRRKFGALLLDPRRNVVLMDGYNGGPRGEASSAVEKSACATPRKSSVEPALKLGVTTRK